MAATQQASKTRAKANRAASLRDNKSFQEFHQEVINEQTAVFQNTSSTPDEIADAHALLRALRKITDRMKSAEFSHKIEEKRTKKGLN